MLRSLDCREEPILVVVVGVEEACDIAGERQVSAIELGTFFCHLNRDSQVCVAQEAILDLKRGDVWAQLIETEDFTCVLT